MDTLCSKQRPLIKKVATSTAGLIIALFLLVIHNPLISAKDISGITGLSPSIVYIKEHQEKLEENFENIILNKYGKSNIVSVDKGIKHIRMIRFFNGKPVRINIVELSKNVNDGLEIEPVIASDSLASRTKISNMANKKDAIVAINGGYFKPQTGVPLGTLMIDKKIYTGPIYDRVAMGFFDNGYGMARVQLKTSIKTNIGGFKIDNINQPRMLSTHTIVYTPLWGKISPPTPKYGRQIVVKNGKIFASNCSQNNIPEDGFVIVGPDKYVSQFLSVSKIKLDIKINPDWKDVNHIISGGPYLIKNGDIFVDMSAQKLSSIGGRNPRTAIGYTKENHLIMLTADGREGASVGLTLMELAELMKELGCVNAMNLDGGGSTVMYINGKIVNKPSVYGGIPLSHSLTVRKVS